MEDSATAVVAVLAGGRGRRLGGAKAAVELNGRTLVSYPLEAARKAGLDALVVAKRASELPALAPDVRVAYEPDEPSHPLCGVLAALRAAERPVVTVGCDMPFLAPELLAWLARQPDEACAAEVGGELQPLPALYRPALAGQLEGALAAGASQRAALERAGARILGEQELRAFGEPRRLCFSVNDPRDLARAQAWLR